MRVVSFVVFGLFLAPSLVMAAVAPVASVRVQTPQGPRTYIPDPPASTTTTTNSATATGNTATTSTTTTTATDTTADGKETHEIGFDAKVKRDPNGNIIEDKPAAASNTTSTGMRSDRGMRNDRTLTH